MRIVSPIVAYRMGLATARDVRLPAVCRQGARRGGAVALAALAALAPLLVARAQTAPPSVASEHVVFRHVTIADGLSQNAVTAIVQDRRGFMWFGTKDGLDRYDGYEFIAYRHDPYDSTSIADSEISEDFEDSRGQLWVGTRNGSVNRFDRTRERFERIVGVPLDKQGVPYTGIHPSYGAGESLGTQLDSFVIGHGLFSLLDTFPFQHPDRPELSVSIPVSERPFGQGATGVFSGFQLTQTLNR